jgi:hypothetical protein
MRPVLLTGVAVAALCLATPSAFAQDHSAAPSMHGAEGGHSGGAAPSMHGSAAPRTNGPGHMEHGSGMAGGEAHPTGQGGMQHVGSMHREQQHTGAMESSHHATHAAGAGERGPMHEGASGGTRHEENASGMNHEENAGGDNREEHAGGGSRHEAARLSSDQRSRFVETIRHEHVSGVDHVSFGVNVGVVVPSRYHYYPLPPNIVSFVPEYRGYYFLVADGDIIIIDPATHEIVDVIPEA